MNFLRGAVGALTDKLCLRGDMKLALQMNSDSCSVQLLETELYFMYSVECITLLPVLLLAKDNCTLMCAITGKLQWH